MKRGIEIQFNWVFILIAGGVILAFFFTIVTKQQTLSSERLAVQLSRDLDTVFSAAIAAKGVAQVLSIPRGGVAFDCTETCDCNFVVKEKPTPFKDKIIFAPETLADEAAVVWALDWKVPFRVTNFLYLGQPSDKYLLVTDPSGANQHSRQLQAQLSRDLPAALQTEFISINDLPTKRLEGRTRVVFLAVNPRDESTLDLDASFKRIEVSGVVIDSRTRQLKFFTREGDAFESQKASYAGDAGMYAALFSTDPQLYQCGVSHSLAKLAHVADIYARRAVAVGNEMPRQNRSDCVYVTDAIDQLRSGAAEKSTAIFPDLAGLELNAQQLNQQNQNLILQSCPELF